MKIKDLMIGNLTKALKACDDIRNENPNCHIPSSLEFIRSVLAGVKEQLEKIEQLSAEEFISSCNSTGRNREQQQVSGKAGGEISLANTSFDVETVFKVTIKPQQK